MPEGYAYNGGEDYVLDRGSPFVSAPLTSEEMSFVRDLLFVCPVRRWLLGHCYYNAQMLAVADRTGQLRYVEGYAVGLACIPVLHGWCTLNGKVVDMTWRTAVKRQKGKFGDRVFGVIPDGWAYYGAEFRTEAVMGRLRRTKVASSYLDDIAYGFPLFQEPRVRSRVEVLREPL